MLLLNVAHETRLTRELPLAGNTLEDGSHLLAARERCILASHLLFSFLHLRLRRPLVVVLVVANLRVLWHDHSIGLSNIAHTLRLVTTLLDHRLLLVVSIHRRTVILL